MMGKAAGAATEGEYSLPFFEQQKNTCTQRTPQSQKPELIMSQFRNN